MRVILLVSLAFLFSCKSSQGTLSEAVGTTEKDGKSYFQMYWNTQSNAQTFVCQTSCPGALPTELGNTLQELKTRCGTNYVSKAMSLCELKTNKDALGNSLKAIEAPKLASLTRPDSIILDILFRTSQGGQCEGFNYSPELILAAEKKCAQDFAVREDLGATADTSKDYLLVAELQKTVDELRTRTASLERELAELKQSTRKDTPETRDLLSRAGKLETSNQNDVKEYKKPNGADGKDCIPSGRGLPCTHSYQCCQRNSKDNGNYCGRSRNYPNSEVFVCNLDGK